MAQIVQDYKRNKILTCDNKHVLLLHNITSGWLKNPLLLQQSPSPALQDI